MANIPVTLAVKNLLDADDNTQFATALGALGAPVETGASIASKLAGETIIGDIKLANTSAVAMENRIIGGGADVLSLVVHGNGRVGGTPIPVGYDDVNIRSYHTVSNAAVIAGDVVLEIGRFRLPDAWYVNGQILIIIADIGFNATTYGGDEIAIGFQVEGQTDFVVDTPFATGNRLFRKTSAFEKHSRIVGVGYLLLDTSPGDIVVSSGEILQGIHTLVGTANTEIASSVPSGFEAGGGTVGSDIIISCRVAQHAGMSGTPINVSVDLKATIVS